MDLIELVRKIQQGERTKKHLYVKKLFDLYKDYFLKQFTIYCPYSTSEDKVRFTVNLGNELFGTIADSFKSFKLKSNYSREELDSHLWKYLKTIADALLDRSLVTLCAGGPAGLKEQARSMVFKKYRSRTEVRFNELLQHYETDKTRLKNSFELEEQVEQESRKLTGAFFETRFPKIITYFEKHPHAIFRKYFEAAIQNFFIDYTRETNAKKMKRLTLYRDDLPGSLFDVLKDLKGYGTLFYYKKRYDCLTIRDTGKALSVIKNLGLTGIRMEQIRRLFKKSGVRAEYQRVIDNMTGHIKEHCRRDSCPDRLLPKYIKALLYMNDYVMQKIIRFTEKTVNEAKRRLETCITCLDIKAADFLSR